MHLESQSHSPAALEALTLLRGVFRHGYAPASDVQLSAAVAHLRRMLGDDEVARRALLWAMTHTAELSVGVAARAYDLSPDVVLDQVTVGLKGVDGMG
ncbi:hypothetical protein [Streptomyces sp. BH105]|uniref:hypothetical protein n=1 Tax=Streptomyces sp. BH105 TaxID=3410408 RepID=UPI003CE7B2EF